MVFQAYNLFPHLSVLDNVTLAPRARARAVARRGGAAGATSCSTGSGWPTRPRSTPTGSPAASSSGSPWCGRSRPDPALLLLDEITAALDPELVGDVLTIVRDLAASGTTMLLATHEMAFARDVATRVCFLDGGRILESGPPEQVFSQPREERTRQFLRRVLP